MKKQESFGSVLGEYGREFFFTPVYFTLRLFARNRTERRPQFKPYDDFLDHPPESRYRMHAGVGILYTAAATAAHIAINNTNSPESLRNALPVGLGVVLTSAATNIASALYEQWRFERRREQNLELIRKGEEALFQMSEEKNSISDQEREEKKRYQEKRFSLRNRRI